MKLRNKRRVLGLTALGCTSLLYGCATEPDITQDPDFGQSVRQMIALQTGGYSESAPGFDSEKAIGIMKEYRKSAAERQQEMNQSRAPNISFDVSQ